MEAALLRVDALSKRFPVERGLFGRPKRYVQSVDGVSFQIAPGETLGLVGESGSGKTTTGKLLLGLLKPDAGSIMAWVGDSPQEVGTLSGKALRRYRRLVQMVPQDPYDALNPARTIYDSVVEPLAAHGIGSTPERIERAERALASTGLTPPSAFLFRYPHQLSGGQRQRVTLARALILSPKLVVADEPGAMLDVSVRAGITALMRKLQQDAGTAYLYITHDLAAARLICHRLAVMQRGRIVETGETERVLQHPQHPYTAALVNATLDIGSALGPSPAH